MAILLELILSIIACIQLHVTMLNVHGEYSKYEAIREYKALKAVVQNRDFFYKWRQIYTVDMCGRIDYCSWILRSFGRSHITKQCACSTAGAIILPPFLRLRVDGRKRFEYATCGREFSKTEEKTSVLKNIRIRVDRALVWKYCIVDRPGKICLTTTGFEPTHTTFGHRPNSEPTELRGPVGSNTDVIFRNRV